MTPGDQDAFQKKLKKISWSQLSELLVKGNVICVAYNIDMFGVAHKIQFGNEEHVLQLMNKRAISRPNEDQIIRWQKFEKEFLMIEINNYILIQEELKKYY